MPLPKAPSQKGDLLHKRTNASQKTPANSAKSGRGRKNVEEILADSAYPAKITNGEQQSSPTPPKNKVTKTPVPPATQRTNKSIKKVPIAQRKLFVADTNVLLHDPSALFRFHEHDVFLPMIVLEELDNHKKGMSEVARNARQISRELDALVGTVTDIETGIPLDSTGHTSSLGSLFFQTAPLETNLAQELPDGKADNQILAVTKALQALHHPRQVVLVSKDINMRLKAKILGLSAEDYRNDNVLEDSDVLPSGIYELPATFWNTEVQEVHTWQADGYQWMRFQSNLCANLALNTFIFLEGEKPLQALISDKNGQEVTIRLLTNHSTEKHNVWGIQARNREQNFALNILLDPQIDFVTLLGQAGTGKTLLALAACLSLVMDRKYYNEIIITRATISVGEDIGFLPGSEEEKMQPWMGALDDNLEVLNLKGSGGEWGRSATLDLIRSRIKIKSLNFMRGRTFLNKLLIIDEAQNLTPKQMKTLITRAGPGTKVICLGNIAQIDTPYLSEGSSGLTYVVDRFQNWQHAAHITLQRGERSRLADYASSAL